MTEVKMSDSDDMFITQNTFTKPSFNEGDINTDFEDLLFDADKPDFEINLDTSDDELLNQTQAFENENKALLDSIKPSTTKQPRFGKELSELDLTELHNSGKNRNTEKKMHWAVRVYASWHKERTNNDNFEESLLIDDEWALNETLIKFVTEARNRNGQEYHGNTLHEILISLQRYIRGKGKDVNFQTDFAFRVLRQTLDAKMKCLAKSGVGIHPKKADVITDEQEELLWTKNILGDDTPQKLLDTVFYLNGIGFCLRGGEEHHSLQTGEKGNFSVIEKNGVTHLKYSEGVTKTNNGGLTHKGLPMKSIIVGPNADNPAICPVRLHEKYMALRYVY